MINLLPYKEKQTVSRVRTLRLVQSIVVSLTLLVLISGLLLFPTLITTNSRFAIATNQINSLQGESGIRTAFDIKNIEARAKLVQSKLSQEIGMQPSDFIEIVRAVSQKGVTITRFVMAEPKTLEVSGATESRESLQAFIILLQKDERIQSIDNPVSNFVKNGNSPFKITILFK